MISGAFTFIFIFLNLDLSSLIEMMIKYFAITKLLMKRACYE